MTRPICACCGKPYGHRYTSSETVRWHEGEPVPQYRGNGIVVKERGVSTQQSRAIIEASLTGKRGDWHNRMIAEAPEQTTHSMTREIWDGESWRGGYDPFCTLRCALSFARASHKAGYRVTKAKGEA